MTLNKKNRKRDQVPTKMIQKISHQLSRRRRWSRHFQALSQAYSFMEFGGKEGGIPSREEGPRGENAPRRNGPSEGNQTRAGRLYDKLGRKTGEKF